MRKLLLVLMTLSFIYISCKNKNQQKEDRYYFKIVQYIDDLLGRGNVTKLDSVFAPNKFAAYDSLVRSAYAINFTDKLLGKDSSLRNFELLDKNMDIVNLDTTVIYENSIKNKYYQLYQKMIMDFKRDNPELYKNSKINY